MLSIAIVPFKLEFTDQDPDLLTVRTRKWIRLEDTCLLIWSKSSHCFDKIDLVNL